MEKYSLRFNEFEANIKFSIREINKFQRYCDVTLASDDGDIFKAHKIVLSAGSTFFSDILEKVDHPNPFIFMKGIRKADLERIVNFIYTGEVCIAQEELNTFLEILIPNH